jgi:GNAT superfamily N-acetyltransferase
MTDSAVEFRRAREQDGPNLVGLFDRADAPCRCRYWQHPGVKNDWLFACANQVESLNTELVEELETSARADILDSVGFVAAGDDQTVGWLRIARASYMHKLYGQRLYRTLPCFSGDRTGVWTVGCFLVDPARRRERIAQGLLDCAVTWARTQGRQEHGILALEALPRRDPAAGDAELFLGPISILTNAGFGIVHEFGPYPVLRLEL